MNQKQGLEYFPMDIDFFQDEKIQFVSARFGLKGEIVVIRLLCRVYRQGYYLFWDEDTALLFAKGVGDGVQHSFVNDVVSELLKRGFFDRSIFERFSVLTSKGIQRRYFNAIERRKGVTYNPQIILIDMSKFKNVSILNENVNILAENEDILKQSKVKESKVNKSKPSPPTPSLPEPETPELPTPSEPPTEEPENHDGGGDKESFALDSGFVRVYKAWEKASALSPTMRVSEELQMLLAEHGADNLCQAINTAVEYQGKVSLAYVKAVLRNKAEGGGGRASPTKKAPKSQYAVLDEAMSRADKPSFTDQLREILEEKGEL